MDDKFKVDEELLKILVCPKCKGPLEYRKDEHVLICHKCKLKFKILEGGIPDMLLEDAEKIE